MKIDPSAAAFVVPAQRPEVPATNPAKATTAATSSGGFEDALREVMQPVTDAGANSNQALVGYLNGESDDLHSVIIAAQQSQMTFDLMLQMRNKLLQAYQEIMQMQV